MSDALPGVAIRVAIRVLDGPTAAYLGAAAGAVLEVPGAEVILILATSPVEERSSFRERLLSRVESAYDWCERRALRGGPAALVRRPSRSWPKGATVVRGTSVAQQVDALRAARADVLIDLVPADSVVSLPIPGSGLWRLRYGDGIGGARLPRLARPARASTGLAESLLSIELDSGTVREAGVGVSALRRVGFARDRDAIYWRSSLLPARRLARLVAGESVPSTADLTEPAEDPISTTRTSGVPPFVGLASAIVGRAVERTLFKRGWVVLVRPRRPDQKPPGDLSGFEPIEAPEGRFYADPFVVAAADGPRIYVEDCPDGSHRGRISSLRETTDGRWALERIALDDLEHRAYPHALNTETGLVVTPDSGRSGGVDLFLDVGPGARFKRIGRCLEGVPASDPTLLWHDGRYWLFVTVTWHGMSPWDELHLFSAAALDGSWQPHPRNPVVADVRRARPAGRIFRQGDQLIRPGQDCSIAYGHRIILNAISNLTPTEFEEHPVGLIQPEQMRGVQRTHTYNFDGPVEVLDAYRRVLRLPGRPLLRR